ncbi:MAG: hypothetical protein WC863_01310 [Patescibacteria group bacterium]
MIYLKTIFSAAAEIKYLKLNIREAFPYIDKFIICEFNRTHTGATRELIFNNYYSEFSASEQAKIIYLGVEAASFIKPAQDNRQQAHKNEKIMRGYFASQIKLANNDIIFSVDADEIIFGQKYPQLIAQLKFWRPAIQLPLYQFYYRLNYLWANNKFIAPTVCRAWYYKFRYPGQWRYAGWIYPEITGCHFSWCLTIPEMLAKIKGYAHQQDYQSLAQTEILTAAVESKTYPFDPQVDFQIKVLDLNKDKSYFPPTLYEILDDFKSLIAKK